MDSARSWLGSVPYRGLFGTLDIKSVHFSGIPGSWWRRWWSWRTTWRRTSWSTARLVALPAAAFAPHASGFYDHQIINYEATAQVTSSPQAAQQISLGNIVYHVVD